MLPHQLQSSPRAITFDAPAELLTATAIKLGLATNNVAVHYAGADLNGTMAAAGVVTPAPNGHTGVAQYPLLTTAAHAAAYVLGSRWVFTGTYGGKAATSTCTIGNADGGETLVGDHPLDFITAIDGEAQQDAHGTVTFGLTDLAMRGESGTGAQRPFRAIRANAAGNIGLWYMGDSTAHDGHYDLAPFTAGETQTVEPFRIVESTTTVAAGFTVYE